MKGKVTVAKNLTKKRVRIDGKTGEILGELPTEMPKGKLNTAPKLRVSK